MFFKQLVILSLLIFSLSNFIYGQTTTPTENILVVRKLNSSKRKYYNVNSPIYFKTKDSLHFGIIQKIEFDSLLIDSVWTNYSSITTIINPNGRHFIKQGSVVFPIAGVTFVLITTLNALINNDRPIFYREHLIPPAGLISTGLIMWPFRTQKYRLKYRWDLFVIPS